jgi:membrane protein YdbS with pleckstrin-like domain
VIPDVDDDDQLVGVDPAYRTVLLLRGSIWAALLLLCAIAAEFLVDLPTGLATIPALAIGGWLALISPGVRFRRLGYTFSEDRLRVVRGYIFYSDTLVPFSRIQHIDVEQGPILRQFGLAELHVHTASGDNEVISVPGLPRADAESMREAIRNHIRQATA